MNTGWINDKPGYLTGFRTVKVRERPAGALDAVGGRVSAPQGGLAIHGVPVLCGPPPDGTGPMRRFTREVLPHLCPTPPMESGFAGAKLLVDLAGDSGIEPVTPSVSG